MQQYIGIWKQSKVDYRISTKLFLLEVINSMKSWWQQFFLFEKRLFFTGTEKKIKQHTNDSIILACNILNWLLSWEEFTRESLIFLFQNDCKLFSNNQSKVIRLNVNQHLPEGFQCWHFKLLTFEHLIHNLKSWSQMLWRNKHEILWFFLKFIYIQTKWH